MTAPPSRKLQTLPLQSGRCCGDGLFTARSGLKQMMLEARSLVRAEEASEGRRYLPEALEAEQKCIKHRSKKT